MGSSWGIKGGQLGLTPLLLFVSSQPRTTQSKQINRTKQTSPNQTSPKNVSLVRQPLESSSFPVVKGIQIDENLAPAPPATAPALASLASALLAA